MCSSFFVFYQMIYVHVCCVLDSMCLIFVYFCFLLFFFFKQKTAYEMRISDWSSDVCSSDLLIQEKARHLGGVRRVLEVTFSRKGIGFQPWQQAGGGRGNDVGLRIMNVRVDKARHNQRSEEHTSELQSLMRTSYAVFCLKKKKTQYDNTCNQSVHYKLN